MGITPNIIVPYSRVSNGGESEEQPPRLLERDLERHLRGTEEEKRVKKPKEEKILDSQLERAVQILKSWEIFQGLSLKK
jgi:hypothetical protein